METTYVILIAIAAALVAGLIAWLIASRATQAARSERDRIADQFKAAIIDLEAEVTERRALEARYDATLTERGRLAEQLAGLTHAQAERDRAHAAQIAQLEEAKAALADQFKAVGANILAEAQKQFLARADDRFKQSEEMAGKTLQALLAPVHERLTQYEEGVRKVEAERREAYGHLTGLIDTMRTGQEEVKRVTASLNNSLRNAPKARGRWGEQQLRNVLERAGLSEYADFATEVSVATAEGMLRPDVVIRVPGGQHLPVDAKVSLNDYQVAFESGDDDIRIRHLNAHTASMRSHINQLGGKAYQNQFDSAPDYVIMFVPGEHFLAAALEHDPALWDYAFDRRVLLATPTNLVAIARTVAGVWRQEKLAEQTREIAVLGKQLYERLSTMGAHMARVGKNLTAATDSYNQLVGSMERNVLTSAKRFEALGVDTGGKELPDLTPVETRVAPLQKLDARDRSDSLVNPARGGEGASVLPFDRN